MRYSFIGTSLLGIGVYVFIALQFAVPALDHATAVQCKTHDWPADKAVATSQWCVANGYAID